MYFTIIANSNRPDLSFTDESEVEDKNFTILGSKTVVKNVVF